MNKKLSIIWFLVGFGSQLQVLFSLSFSEILVAIAAPLLLFSEMSHMRRTGVATFLTLSFFVTVGCIVASLANNTIYAFAMRGLSVCVIVSCSVIFSHWLIRKNPNGFKWMFLGGAISLIVCIFVFRRSVEVSMYGDDVRSIMSGQLFWSQRISPWILLPTRGWYLNQSPIVNAVAPLISAIVALVYSSGSGRSSALSAIAFSALTIIGGKRQSTMRRVSRHFWMIVLVAVVSIGIMHVSYRMLATKGMLGDKALEKYELQTRGEKGIMRLLLGGRADSFIGLLACRDKPIVGWGPWAEDTNGYRREFMEKYGTIEDFVDQIKRDEGGYYESRLNLISCHSHITEFWLWFGLPGLLFIIYILFVFIRFLRQDAAAVPQWFAWLACGIPGMIWHIFFSPFHARVGLPLMVVACLMARAVRRGSFQLPNEMIKEIVEAERK